MKKLLKSLFICFSTVMFLFICLGAADKNQDHEGFETIQNMDDEIGGAGGDTSCPSVAQCDDAFCVISNAKNRFLARGCKCKCGYWCTVQKVDWKIGL